MLKAREAFRIGQDNFRLVMKELLNVLITMSFTTAAAQKGLVFPFLKSGTTEVTHLKL